MRRAQRFLAAAALPLLPRLREWASVFGSDLPRLLRPELRAAAAGIDFPADVRLHAAAGPALSRVLYANFLTYLPGDLLVKMDRTSMAHGLETRSPFLDHALVEYVAGLPARFKLRRGTSKWILKRAFADLVPPAVLTRPKRGFGVPLGAWFRGALRDDVRAALTSASSRAHDYVEPAYVTRLVREHLAGQHDHGHRLWTLLTFETWLRRPASR